MGVDPVIHASKSVDVVGLFLWGFLLAITAYFEFTSHQVHSVFGSYFYRLFLAPRILCVEVRVAAL